MIRLSLFLLAALASTLACADGEISPSCPRVLGAVYPEIHGTEGVYLPFKCCGNVQRLVNKLKERNIPTENARVVFLIAERYRGSDVPVFRLAHLTNPPNARQNDPHVLTWPAHVVLEVNGQIYDLARPSPEPTSAADYLASMFPRSVHHPEGNLGDHILVRSVPPERFLSEYNELGENGLVERYAGRPDKVGEVYNIWIDARTRAAPDSPIQTFNELLGRR